MKMILAGNFLTGGEIESKKRKHTHSKKQKRWAKRMKLKILGIEKQERDAKQ